MTHAQCHDLTCGNESQGRNPAMTNIVTIQRRADTAHFARMLPTWFLACTLLAASAPGHGWQLFAIGAIPGVWAAIWFGASESLMGWLLPTLVVGVPMLWFLGRLLDRLGSYGATLLMLVFSAGSRS